MSSCAPSARLAPGGRVVSYLAEILRLSPADVRAVGISLQASLSSTNPGTENYKVPGDQDLVVFSAQGYLRMPTLNTEPQVILGFLNLDPSERWLVKAQNCLVQLENTDRSLKIFDSHDIPLSVCTPPVGQRIEWPVESPLLVPAGHNLRATFTLQDSTAAIVGNSTVYGLHLAGALIPKRN